MSLGNICYFHDVHALFSYSITRWSQSHLTTGKAVRSYLYAQLDFFPVYILLRELKALDLIPALSAEVHLSVLYCFCFGREVFFTQLTIPVVLYFVFLSPWCILVIYFFAHTWIWFFIVLLLLLGDGDLEDFLFMVFDVLGDLEELLLLLLRLSLLELRDLRDAL